MKYDVERAVVTLSVRELCTLALTGGDLDLRVGGKAASFERAALGAKVHRKLQAEAGCEYRAELPLTSTVLYHNLSFEVSGRADGLLLTDPLTVDEIKTVYGRAFDLPPAPMHDAQVKCYAYFLCREKGLDHINTRLTYYRMEDGKTKYLTRTHQMEELQHFYFELLSRVEYRAKILIERQTVLIPSVQSAHFPYSSVRDGQDIMIRECYRDIKAGKRLFAQAPTGTGKTLSALYPAVRCLGEGYLDKIFYLTAKATTRREAYRAAGQLFESGSHLRTVVLTAREQLCQNQMAKADPVGISRHCNPADCPFAKGFYDRSANAVCEMLSTQSGFDSSAILRFAKQYHVCPYELQLELSEFCDIVICDYNYVFDPQIYLRRYFAPEVIDGISCAFLIDEAHNLFDRALSMYSVSLSDGEVSRVLSVLPPLEDRLRLSLEKLAVTLSGFRRLCKDTIQKDEEGRERGYYINRRPIDSLLPLVQGARSAAEEWLKLSAQSSELAEVYALAVKLKRFEKITECYDEGFLTFITLEDGICTLRLICLDPSRILSACHGRARASVLFSATLTPPEYFSDILGGGKQAVHVSLPSPYDPSHCCIAAVTGVSTRYEDREKSYKKLSSMIAATVSAKKGNYIVYFPSYEYLEKVVELFTKRYTGVETVIQKRGMTHQEREEFLASFCDDGKLRIGFCVLGGSFSEGVDLPGGRLIGSIVVGTGLPGISNERNILREYYDNTRENGFDYAYTYPGINRVLQAAGRVIRREEDRGIVVLIDDRYAEPRLRSLLPDHLQNLQYARNASELAEIAEDFWNTLE